jgi:hypothetical protein
MDGDAVLRLILARCSDALDEATTADLIARLEGMVVPISTFEHVLEVLGLFEERLAKLERVNAQPKDNRLRFGSHAVSGAPHSVVNDEAVYEGDGVRPIRVETKRRT